MPNTEDLQENLKVSNRCISFVGNKLLKTRFGETRKEDEKRAGMVHIGVQYAIMLHALFRTDEL
jgi:hypothetical protein